jgi:hypothetical protein
MFTLKQIERAHDKVKSVADFPEYIQEIKQLGVIAFETRVFNSHTEYSGKGNYHAKSLPKYTGLKLQEIVIKKNSVNL